MGKERMIKAPIVAALLLASKRLLKQTNLSGKR
jgi:hypothetical protein